jgi:heptosyltransferase-1
LKVLIVKLSSLGDVIQTMPVIEDMKASLPDVTIDWVVEEAFSDLVAQARGINRVISCAERRWRKSPFNRETRQEWTHFWQTLREVSYDVVIDFQGLIKSARIARGARLTPTGLTATYGNKSELCAYEWPVKWMLQKTVLMEKKIHAVARYRALAARVLGYESTGVLQKMPSYPFVAVEHESRKGIMFSHGTTRLDNEWSFESWVELGQRLIQQGEVIFLPQANSREADFVQRLADVFGEYAHVLPRMKLSQLLSKMANCRAVISVDSGLGHLAVALNLPVIQIFSQPRIERAGPVGVSHQCAVGGDHVPSVNEVWDAYVACMDADSQL